MAELKTKKNTASVKDFLAKIENPEKRKDAETLVKIFIEIIKEKPVMWGSAIIGFGEFRYKYASGREGDWMAAGFSPRKTAFSLYLSECMYGFDKFKDLLDKLGKHTTGAGCLYIKKLSDVDVEVLKKLIKASLKLV